MHWMRGRENSQFIPHKQTNMLMFPFTSAGNVELLVCVTWGGGVMRSIQCEAMWCKTRYQVTVFVGNMLGNSS